MKEPLSRRVMDELEASGYEPRLHEPTDGDGAFEISLPGAGFDVGDFKAMVGMAERLGVGLSLDDRGWITLR
jgi:hypothetical protein